MKSKIFLVLLILAFFSSGCRKEIDVPNAEMSKLFGEWDWFEKSGGMDGATYTPANQGYIMRVEFSDKGIYKRYLNNSQNAKAKFDLSEGTSIFGNVPAYIITYHDNTGFLGTEEVSTHQSFKFWGSDTLILIDESYDGYNHYYVKKY